VRSARHLVASLAAVIALAACSGGSTPNPDTLLAQAKTTLDATPGLHFALSSTGAPDSGTVLAGGTGDVARPSSFKGTLQVRRSGLLLSVDVISVDGQVLLRLPLTSSYVAADPHKYGFSDPGKLLDTDTGISKLLADATSVRSAGRDRYHGEVLDEVAITLPGTAVQQVLTSADPAKPVTGKLGINPKSHQLRRAVLSGPFLKRDVTTTFTIVLDQYGEHPTIRVAG
jgi:lipoprotein LprG